MADGGTTEIQIAKKSRRALMMEEAKVAKREGDRIRVKTRVNHRLGFT